MNQSIMPAMASCKTSVVSDIKGSYTWAAAETCVFVYFQSPTISGAWNLKGQFNITGYDRRVYNAIGTLLTVPMEYIGLKNTSATEKSIAFQDYLLLRIMSYKNGNMRENKILYNTIYKDSGIERPKLSKDFKRDRDIIKKLLDEWLDQGLITGYEDMKEAVHM